MREIKFRSWIEKGQFMAIQGTPDLETLQSFIFHYGNNKLDQYSGLKDKNGVEIYENDIVRILGGVEYQGIREYDVTGIIKFSYGVFSVVKDEVHYDFGHFDSIEIIGNIHQKPELLK